jgi:flagellar protein FliJ
VAKFVFPLERLLRLRRQQERLAEVEMLRAKAAHEAAKAKAAELRERLTKLSDDLSATVGQTYAARLWATSADQSLWLSQAVTAADVAVREAADALRVADRKRAGIAAEVEALNTLRGEHLEAFKQDQQKAEQDRVDEAGLRRFMAGVAESE